MTRTVSVVIPAKNEAASIGNVVAAVAAVLPGAEIIVVDDGSADGTGEAAAAAGAQVLRHRVSRGNGAAVKSGARQATGSVLVFMDADGQHDPRDIPRLLALLDEGYDMAVGSRARQMHAGTARWLANSIYNRLASWMTGTNIPDLTSGFRAARSDYFREFLPLLPNGFSYPTTSTMAFLRAGYGVAFEPVNVNSRAEGTQSHVRPLLDGGRFLLIIFRVATLYAPLKLFAPLSALLFAGGLAYSTYTLTMLGRFTNFGALLLVTALLVFLIGLVSEQITALIYKR